jgi:hypothetical protein
MSVTAASVLFFQPWCVTLLPYFFKLLRYYLPFYKSIRHFDYFWQNNFYIITCYKSLTLTPAKEEKKCCFNLTLFIKLLFSWINLTVPFHVTAV